MAYLKNKNTSIVIPNTPPIPEFGQEFSPDPTPYNGSHPERHAKPAAGFETPHARLRAYREELLNEQLQQPPTNDVPDASSKAKLEKRIRSYQVSLQQASNRHHVYNELFALAPVAYITLDARGTIQMVNLAATRLLGISQSILTNQAFYTLVAPEDRAQVRVHLDDASPSNASTNCEVTLLLPNDRKVDVMLATTGLRTKNDSANAYQIMLMDNSAHLHNEKLWRNAKDYMEELALHDPLTKLPNRYKFNTTLDNVIDSCKAKDTTLGLIYFDLDGFKPVNDTLGHTAGDAVLEAVASRLTQVMGSRENTARIGGDEFTVIVKDVKSREDVLTLAKKLGDAIKLPISAGEQQANISCSMGVCFYPDHARTAEELVKRADKAMYKAKNSGDGRVYVYSQEEFLDSDRQARILAALPKAISNHEFSLAYQPIHDIATHQSKMAEALLRWHHPELGNVSPDEFIPLAEQSDMISKIGEWVLHEVCLQIKQWRSVGFEIAIAMNVSSRQLTNPQFAEQVLRCLDQYQIPNGLLEIEITETAMMTEPDICCATLQTLANKGHAISMDDFGTGHSSLARLAKLPVNRLKIDRSFICEVETSNSSRALIKAIVSMADSLGMQVIAEGIENEVQKSFLRSIGCTRIQGFLMSRPKPASETLHRIEQLKEALPE